MRANSKNGKYKKIKYVKKASAKKYVNKKLKKGKYYYYKMRAVTKIKNLKGKVKTYYGKWTAVKTIKAKK